MKYYIITGTSKGLGEAIAYGLINTNTRLFCISRTNNEQLTGAAIKMNCKVHYYPFDLHNVTEIDKLVQDIFGKIDKAEIESLTLINNASIISPTKKAEGIFTHDIINNFNVNLIAPFILTTHFLRLSEQLKCNKLIINISSGAGKKPYFGWSAYCTSKAALEMFTKVIGLEQADREDQTTIISFNPGIIDTDMQAEIRETDERDFTSVRRFQDFKKSGKLLNPSFVSEKLIELMNSPGLIQGGTYDIRDLASLVY